MWPMIAIANPYTVLHDQSTVSFFGKHAGNEFNGAFKDWSANIIFNPDDLKQSSVKVVFKTASAETGNPMYDGTLPTADWFDVESHPIAIFESDSFTKKDGKYTVDGDLTIKDITTPITFDFNLSDTDIDPITMASEFQINRLDFNIGTQSDPNAEWVDKLITIKIALSAEIKS